MNDLVIGVLGRPHGVDGALRVRSYSDETEHFRALSEVELERDGVRRTHRLTSVRIDGKSPVVCLEGVSDRDAAARWTGWEIRVPREQAAPLGDDEYYLADLVGCDVVADGVTRGTVAAVVDATQAPLLEIKPTSGDGNACFVPFLAVYVRSVQVDARTIELEEAWILDFA